MTSSPPNSVTEKHLGRTHAQPLRRCTTKNHLEAKDVEAEDVDDDVARRLSPRLTRTCSGTSKAAKGRRPI